MKNPCAQLIPHWVSFVSSSLRSCSRTCSSMVSGQRQPSGLASRWRASRGLPGWPGDERYRYAGSTNCTSAIELESLATAFAGSFLVFVAYWLLQLSGVLPPLRGLYFMLVMLTLMNMGTDGAWQRILRRRPR